MISFFRKTKVFTLFRGEILIINYDYGRAQTLRTEQGMRLYLAVGFSVKNSYCCPAGFTTSRDVTS